MWEDIVTWLLGLGDQYGVDPLVYAVVYVGALPFMLLSLAWLVRRLRRGQPIVIPLASAIFFFLAPNLYIVLAGRDLPTGVYAVLVVLTVIGAITTWRRVRERVHRGARYGNSRGQRGV